MKEESLLGFYLGFCQETVVIVGDITKMCNTISLLDQHTQDLNGIQRKVLFQDKYIYVYILLKRESTEKAI